MRSIEETIDNASRKKITHRLQREDTDLHVENVFGFGFRHAAIVSGRKAPCCADEIA